MNQLRRPNVQENAQHLTVALCMEHLMRLDELIEVRGPMTRYLECREFFARHLERCQRRREMRHCEHFDRVR